MAPLKVDKDFAGLSPIRIQTTSQGLYLGLEGGRFVAFDKTKRGPLKRNIVGEPAGDGLKVGGIFDWEVSGGKVFAYGDLGPKEPGADLSKWSSAFLRFSLGQSMPTEVFRPRQYPDPARVFYRLGYPMLASVENENGGETAYAVVMDSPMGIYRLRSDSQDLEPISAFPKELEGKAAPLLPAFIKAEDFPTVMQAVEESRMPAGLYGWNGALFLLYRVPEKGGTRWMLSKIEPPDRVVATQKLPLQADHLTVIPGPKAWAFLAKGRVERLGNQELKQVLLIPATSFLGEMKGNFCRNFR